LIVHCYILFVPGDSVVIYVVRTPYVACRPNTVLFTFPLTTVRAFGSVFFLRGTGGARLSALPRYAFFASGYVLLNAFCVATHLILLDPATHCCLRSSSNFAPTYVTFLFVVTVTLRAVCIWVFVVVPQLRCSDAVVFVTFVVTVITVVRVVRYGHDCCWCCPSFSICSAFSLPLILFCYVDFVLLILTFALPLPRFHLGIPTLLLLPVNSRWCSILCCWCSCCSVTCTLYIYL
jgi:hypothetical protein